MSRRFPFLTILPTHAQQKLVTDSPVAMLSFRLHLLLDGDFLRHSAPSITVSLIRTVSHAQAHQALPRIHCLIATRR